jgi:predicted RecA/RadA family phage recombinase
MRAVYVGVGDSIPYIPSSDVPAGEVVSFAGDRVYGVTRSPILAGELGSLATVGVFDLAKGSDSFVVGDEVYWDKTNKVAVKTAGANRFRIGLCYRDAAAGDARVRVKIG